MRQPYPPNSNLLVSFALAEENLAKELGVEKCDTPLGLKAGGLRRVTFGHYPTAVMSHASFSAQLHVQQCIQPEKS